jgi:hypothetical protein
MTTRTNVMSGGALLSWLVSGAVLIAVLLYELVKTGRSKTEGIEPGQQSARKRSAALFLGSIVVLVVLLWAYILYAPGSEIEAKAATSPTPWRMVLLMYVAMLFGIVAQAYYFTEDTGPAARTSSFKAALASPIIFIPLISSYQSSLMNLGAFSIPELMILLVSFQNGFFWKVVFDKQAELLSKHRQ